MKSLLYESIKVIACSITSASVSLCYPTVFLELDASFSDLFNEFDLADGKPDPHEDDREEKKRSNDGPD